MTKDELNEMKETGVFNQVNSSRLKDKYIECLRVISESHALCWLMKDENSFTYSDSNIFTSYGRLYVVNVYLS